jgi:hypothetical protein
MVPIIQGKIHHFGPRGLYNGLVLLGDDETGSFWDHITGECVHGSLKGKWMDTFPIDHTTVTRGLKKWPDLQIAFSRPPLWIRLLSPLMLKRMRRKGLFPPGFRKTMSSVDTRLQEMASGLGVVTDEVARFYPVEAIKEAGGKIQDQLDGRRITVYIDPEDQVPHAIYDNETDEQRPMQLFSRWYGFYLTYPECDIYTPKEK